MTGPSRMLIALLGGVACAALAGLVVWAATGREVTVNPVAAVVIVPMLVLLVIGAVRAQFQKRPDESDKETDEDDE